MGRAAASGMPDEAIDAVLSDGSWSAWVRLLISFIVAPPVKPRRVPGTRTDKCSASAL
jgi:hypothetical protein